MGTLVKRKTKLYLSWPMRGIKRERLQNITNSILEYEVDWY